MNMFSKTWSQTENWMSLFCVSFGHYRNYKHISVACLLDITDPIHCSHFFPKWGVQIRRLWRQEGLLFPQTCMNRRCSFLYKHTGVRINIYWKAVWAILWIASCSGHPLPLFIYLHGPVLLRTESHMDPCGLGVKSAQQRDTRRTQIPEGREKIATQTQTCSSPPYMAHVITFAKEVMFPPVSVCLFADWFVSRITHTHTHTQKKLPNGFPWNLDGGRVSAQKKKTPLSFAVDPGI